MSIIGDGVTILGLVDKGHNAPLYKQLGEWIDKVGDLQKELDDARTEVKQLRDELRFKGSIERVEGHTFIKGEDDEICPSCVAVNMRIVHLVPMPSKLPPYQKATCPACKTAYHHNAPRKRNVQPKSVL